MASSFQDALRRVIADRHSPEARSFYQQILQYVEGRVKAVWRRGCADVISAQEVEEIMSEVMVSLMNGGLVRFRGETLGELLAYVRTVTDRTLIHSTRRRLRERAVLQENARELAANPPMVDPEEIVRQTADNPLSDKDQAYLLQILEAGGMAAYARAHDQSRAAVTLRVQRIRSRIEAMSSRDQAAVESWLRLAVDRAAS